MSYEEIFNKLKSFLEKKPASTHAIPLLDSQAEIRIVIDGQLECRLINNGGSPLLTQEPAKNPDVEFCVALESLRLLDHISGDNMTAFGIEVVKEVVAGNIKIKVCNGLSRLLSGGYLKIIKAAGPDFAQYLARYGFKGIGKIINLFKSLSRS